jgi:hypothetical protein
VEDVHVYVDRPAGKEDAEDLLARNIGVRMQ